MAEIHTYYFEEGNTVRVAEESDFESVRIREREERIRRKKAAKRRKAAAARRNRVYAMYMSTVVVACVGFFVGYVYLQSSITTSLKNINSLETQVSELKAQNTACANRINSNANLQNVKQIAVNDLGMVYAKADQIVYYDMESSDYMNQYSDIP